MKEKLTGENKESFLIFNHQQNNIQEQYHYILQVVISSLLFILFMLYIQSFLALTNVTLFIYLPGLMLHTILFMRMQGKRTIFITGYLFIAACLLIIFHTHIINGLFISLNELFVTIGNYTGEMIAPYGVDLPSELHHHAVGLFLMYLGLFVAYIAYALIKFQAATLLWILFVMTFILQSMLQLEGLFIVNILSIFIGIYLSVRSIYKKTNIIGSSKRSVFSIVSLYFLIVFVLVSTALMSFQFNGKNDINHTVQLKTKQFLHDFRYEQERTNTFTEGNFTDLGKLELRELPALEVVMEKPISVYLRGYVGSVYTSDKWTDLQPEVYYENSNLFYWLNEIAFHPLNQLSTVNELMGDDTLSNKTTMTIHNLQANSHYLYTPYELMTDVNEFDDLNMSQHQSLVSDKFFGERVYQFNTYNNLVSHYPTLANYLYESKQDEEKEEYKDHEHHYNRFVYDTYTEIPKEIEMMLETFLKKEANTEGHIAYEKAISMVRDFLSRRISYQLNPEALPEDSDFLTHVLEDSREGYATHYATAATMMFRYLDIPARYVEGYLITPEDVKDKEAYEKVNIEGTNAHAWTEIYIDQLGWIPIETTPPYYNMMEKIDTSNYPKGMEDNDSENDIEEEMNQSSGTKKVKEEEEKDVLNKKDKKETTNWKSYLLYIGFSIIFLLLIVVIAYYVKKRLALKRLKQSFYDDNTALAVSRMFSYSLFLLYYDGIKQRGGSFYTYAEDIQMTYSPSYAEQFKKAVTLNQMAIYSNQEITKADHQYMLEYVETTVEKVIESKGLFKRLKMQLWDFIY